MRWTSADLEVLPENGSRYEIIDGELHVSRQPHWNHQIVCSNAIALLKEWSRQAEGRANLAPGIIFADDEDVAPDVVWISDERLAAALRGGKLHAAPELVVEVLSPGSTNERRDREAKLKLYSNRGVEEYWIIDWRLRQIEIHRRDEGRLKLAATLFDEDTLATPLLPDFEHKVADLFEGISAE